jgi:RNA polymerase sigma-70 factor (ECF subfamily)
MKCLMQTWEQHEAELRGWLRKHLSNPDDVQDLMQELFLKALRQDTQFCGLDNARAWLFAVARNTLIDRARRSKELVELPDDLPDDRASDSGEQPPVESLTACLPRALAELPDDDREAITLCDIDGMSQEAFAKLKGLSLPGAKSRIQRARKRLKTHLETHCQVRYDEVGKVCCFVPRTP